MNNNPPANTDYFRSFPNGCTVEVGFYTEWNGDPFLQAKDPSGKKIGAEYTLGPVGRETAERVAREWTPPPVTFTGDYSKWPTGTYVTNERGGRKIFVTPHHAIYQYSNGSLFTGISTHTRITFTQENS